MPLEHPSYPGYFGQTIPEGVAASLALIADTMIPSGEGYPPAGEAEVVHWISERIAPAELAWLEATLTGVDTTDPAGWLRQLETGSPTDFATLRGWIYKAYYLSPAVLGALHRRGYDYHGAPQPYGYEIAPHDHEPEQRRGSFVPIEEVRRVL